MNTSLRTALLTFFCSFLIPSLAQEKPTPLGIFENHTDVGTLLHPGSAQYDQASSTYTLTGSGANMWMAEDDFHFVWKKVSGDVFLSSDVALVGDTGNPHRKAVLMIRQSLDPASPAVDIALHGNTLAALQFRLTPGGIDREVEFALAPSRLRLEKRGDIFYAFADGPKSDPAGHLQPTGASIKLPLTGDFYIGIGVCAHDKDATTTATFRNVKLAPLTASKAKPVLWSTLETVPIASTDRHVVYTAPQHFEAPNWSRDGSFFLFNQDGGIYRLPVDADTKPAEPTRIPTGPQIHCNNDHGLSPDGRTLAISDSTAQGKSLVYTVPLAGGTPKQITTVAPSYWHGFSPDGQTIAFTSTRDNNSDVYTIPAAGGPEHRLTTDPGIDNGPDFSPDGQWIYFNSERWGGMQIGRMHPDGSSPEQVLTTDTTDWFPHISPDGKWMVFLSYEKGVKGHPADKDVTVNLMSLTDRKTKVLATLFGGQGTVNVPSWSPDSTKIAFVSYQYLTDEPRE